MDVALTDFALMAVAVLAAGRGVARAIRLARADARQVALTCPKTAARVHCVVLSERPGGPCLGVSSCTGWNPQCTGQCVPLLNAGVPLALSAVREPPPTRTSCATGDEGAPDPGGAGDHPR